MSQSFAEIVRHDENLLALLKHFDRGSPNKNDSVKCATIGEICDKIKAIDTKNPKRYSRRIAWTITGHLLLNLTKFYSFYVELLFDDGQRLKGDINRNKWTFANSQTTKRKVAPNKKGGKTARGGKKRRIDNAEEDENEENEQMAVDREPFWEVPLQLEINIDLKNDSCLVPAEQITLRERDYNKPSRMNDTYDELFNEGFGEAADDDTLFDFDEDVSAIVSMISNRMVVDENMNDIMPPDIDFEPIQLPDIDSTQRSVHENENIGTVNIVEKNVQKIPSLLAELSSIPSIPSNIPKIVRAKKNIGKTRRTTLLVDDEKMLSTELMKQCVSDVFIGCNDHASVINPALKRFNPLKWKPSRMFTAPAINGLQHKELFARGTVTRPMPNDWAILNDVIQLGNEDPESESSEAGEILQTEHGSRLRTRNQHQLNANESSFFQNAPQLTSTPARPLSRQSDRSVHTRSTFTASRVNAMDLITPPTAFNNVSRDQGVNIIAPPSPFQNSPIGPPIDFDDNMIGSIGPPTHIQNSPIAPPMDFDDDMNGLMQNNNNEVRSIPSSSTFLCGQKTVDADADVPSSGSEPVENADLEQTLGKNSSEYASITKLIRLWDKNVHQINVDRLLKKGCNRLQAAKTFASLLSLKKKNLIEMENSSDGIITRILPGPQMDSTL